MSQITRVIKDRGKLVRWHPPCLKGPTTRNKINKEMSSKSFRSSLLRELVKLHNEQMAAWWFNCKWLLSSGQYWALGKLSIHRKRKIFCFTYSLWFPYEYKLKGGSQITPINRMDDLGILFGKWGWNGQFS